MPGRGILITLMGLGAAACGSFSQPLPVPTPAEIPGLEARVSEDPTDLDATLLLAMGYRDSGEVQKGLTVVEKARGSLPDEPGLLLMEGILLEEAGQFLEARNRYEAFLETGPTASLRDQVQDRLELIRTDALRSEVMAALSQEASVGDSDPDPSLVGVFPFAYSGTDPEWEPLEDALAELLITDLGITGRLRVLERVKIKALLQEIALAESGLVDEETAARGGRILGSGQLVQGQFSVQGVDRLGMEATVVRVQDASPGTFEAARGEGRVDQLFDLEKTLALDLHRLLGIQLTPAEEARIGERHTESVQALLAFGRGLSAADRGAFEEAEAHFSEATRIDPGFRLAASRGRAASLSSAGRAGQLRSQLQNRAQRLARQRAAVQGLRNAPVSVRQQILRNLGQRKRAILAEVLGQDRLGTSILLELVFLPPGGIR